jgi:hypothetical protein
VSKWAGIAAILIGGTLLGGVGVLFLLLALIKRRWKRRAV